VLGTSTKGVRSPSAQEIAGSNQAGGIVGKDLHTCMFARGSVAVRMMPWPGLWPKREYVERSANLRAA
jgi:hypothetical protein